MSWAEVSARRLDRHALSSPAAGPVDAVAAMCGAHAQVMSAAELSVGLRLADGTRADVRDALWTDRSLVKTFGPRGTVHLLPARDLPMWTAALAAIPVAMGQFPDDVRLTPAQTEQVVAAIDVALADAELTIDELSAAVVEHTGPWAGDPVMPAFGELWPRWRQAVTPAAYQGVLCFGANRGRKVTYASPRRWLARRVPAEAALPDLVRRYLHAYGPATPEHFARWLGAPRLWAAELFESLGGELAPVELDGTVMWLAADDTAMPAEPPNGLRLLPYFDPYVVGGRPRELLFPGRAAERALAGGQAGTFPVLLVDGTVAGVWHHRRTGRRLDITVEPVGGLTSARRRELDERVARVGEILEGRPELTIGPVTVRAHA
ncbi:MAG TPA: winged helix DNA-binding domain-containing protein [Pseudonocardiaceae bacterium]|nr:winged helix DNA-binding domain-containing protein [Pseudonocardiaceae bacterium]